MNSGVANTPGGEEKPAIPDHTLLRCIGSGSYGEVWLARNVVGTLRAVKVVRRATYERSEHFEREFRGIQKFEPISRAHEGFVDVLQIGRNDEAGYFYYVMELADDANGQEEAPPHLGPLPREGELSSARRRVVAHRIGESGPIAVPSPGGEGQGEAGQITYVPKTLRAAIRPETQLSDPNSQPTPTRLPICHCVDIGVTLASALAHLHKHGLVHRDIKPSNIIFVGGVPKLADIGLVADASEARSFVGTLGFIPPEGPGSPQADLYSLGKVLYEISTGRDREDFPQLPPDLLRGTTRAPRVESGAPSDSSAYTGRLSAMRNVFGGARAIPASLIELNEVLLRACHKDVRQRYPSASAMLADLQLLQCGQSVQRNRSVERQVMFAKRVIVTLAVLAIVVTGSRILSNRLIWRNSSSEAISTTPSRAFLGIKSIAVLPFDNESPDKADVYLGQSVAEELSSALAKIPELRVLGRDSAAALKRAKDRHVAGQQLKVNAFLAGTVRKIGNQLRLTAQLINTADDSLRWSEVYDRPLGQVFGIQTDIAEQVAEKLNFDLTDTVRERLAAKPTKNFEAYQFYREGRNHLTGGLPVKAIEDFRSAIRLDTNFALAYAGLADSYSDAAARAYLGISTKDCRSNALQLAEKAVALDDRSAEAHTSLAKARFPHYDWEGAEKEFQWAIRLNPNYAPAHQKYAKLLCIRGRFDQAITVGQSAREHDPWSPGVGMSLGWTLFDARKYAEAEKEFRRVLELDQNFGDALSALGWCHEANGKHDEAVALWKKVNDLWSISPERNAALTEAYKLAGMRGYWKKHRELNVDPQPYWIAADYASIGDNDEAFRWLEQAYEQHSSWMPLVALEYQFYSLHSDPRFAELLKKLRLEMPVWKK